MKNLPRLKRNNLIYPELSYQIEQVIGYLKAFNLKLGIIATFTSKGLKFKRIVNIK